MNDKITASACSWAMWCHLSSLAWIPAMFLGIPIPMGGFVVPLLIWLAKREAHPFIDDQGKESVNFQLSMLLYSLAAFILLLLLVPVVLLFGGARGDALIGLSIALLIGLILGLAGLIGLFELVVVIFAAAKAGNGEFYRYPLTIRFLT
ncbi:hypothetical protein BST81_04830 [Leptolyngbya sp. 'hensonii']|uniref:DUF4870 domain-containing protein n=1 Tax=Leptolyngbya sp. 'hensonii' TaxID=1922337 RepID=UPI00094FCAB5|nr:DUF4870 domain-containing protein [Leptolyngbya sp. 'hensonii']OLP19590.1 hypothetical protein BST81_04830 [Leptolyngbya sp. 'hensonii']